MINLLILTAIRLAQREILNKDELDKLLAERHKRPGEIWQPSVSTKLTDVGKAVRSWVVFEPQIDISDQDLGSGRVVHGILDYIIGVVSAQQVNIVWDDPERPFTAGGLECSTSSISVTKEFGDAEGQVLTQGASLCISTKRSAMVNVLTDGSRWQFYLINRHCKITDDGHAFGASRTRVLHTASRTDLPVILRLLVISIILPATEFAAAAGRIA
ncbi:hypothetical protein B0H19DRAFT_1249631 [Mycena capillaripes]|nr:hypothetical protein B0H19DRAFT_1249631 [Mycena capillaripes]